MRYAKICHSTIELQQRYAVDLAVGKWSGLVLLTECSNNCRIIRLHSRPYTKRGLHQTRGAGSRSARACRSTTGSRSRRASPESVDGIARRCVRHVPRRWSSTRAAPEPRPQPGRGFAWSRAWSAPSRRMGSHAERAHARVASMRGVDPDRGCHALELALSITPHGVHRTSIGVDLERLDRRSR